jgi:glutathione synthase/RimK-type ligase-like ATP-grasp enzyme
MKRVAFVTYHKAPNLTADDALALAPLQQFGIAAIPAIWDDPQVDWKTFDAVVMRSCWDYHHKPRDFSRWIGHLEELKITVWNPAEILRWNMNKTYLRELAAQGVAIPPTVWLEAGSSADLYALLAANGFEQAVIKPTISATAYQTFHTSLATARHDQLRLDTILRTSGALVQQFVEEVKKTGEWSLLFFDGKFSHAVLKRPRDGDFRVQADFGGTSHRLEPAPALIKQAEAIVNLIGQPLLYARVDGFDLGGKLVLLELELLEPALFLEMDAPAPQRFAAALASVI